ncbi:hypothetical protein M0R45_020428 [Rubus argutus]|uniref:Uncharacterized protein n=1 Tax=Rubus argutus TaxID=59490 RepID=A0AAW1XBU4_RUBAR
MRNCLYSAFGSLIPSKEDGIKSSRSRFSHPGPWFKAIALTTSQLAPFRWSSNSGNDRCRGRTRLGSGVQVLGQGIGIRAVKMVANNNFFNEWTHLERSEALVDVDMWHHIGFLRRSGSRENREESTL